MGHGDISMPKRTASSAAVAVGPVGSSSVPIEAGNVCLHGRKRRCWRFHVTGNTRDVNQQGAQDAVSASFREKYTATKRLSFSAGIGSENGDATGANKTDDTPTPTVLVEVQFSGPQPGEGPAGLLRGLLCGTSVEFLPVKLQRGRKKNTEADTTGFSSVEASDSGHANIIVQETPMVESNPTNLVEAPKGETGYHALRTCDDDGTGQASPSEEICDLLDVPTSGTDDTETDLTSDHEQLWSGENSEDLWSFDDVESALYSSTLSPKDVQPPPRLFDSLPCDKYALDGERLAAGAFWGSDLFIPPAKAEEEIIPELETSADGCSERKRGGETGKSGVVPESIWPIGGIRVETLPEECDFDGRTKPLDNATSSPWSTSLPTGRQQLLVLTGLEGAGEDLQALTATLRFWVDSLHKVDKAASPMQVGVDGRVYAAVLYPTMEEIWPELYNTPNVHVVQVDVAVELRSRHGEVRFLGPEFKVSYRRTFAPDDKVAQGRENNESNHQAPGTFQESGAARATFCGTRVLIKE